VTEQYGILACPPLVFRTLEICGLVGADRLVVTIAADGKLVGPLVVGANTA